MIDHDRLFKELISTFFVEFLELFLPQVVREIDRESIQFLPQEVFNDVTSGDKKEIDLLAQVRYQQQETYFLIHVENQSY
ncbi:Rpn family recombination-promoting nuclease/putative transposase, partial [Anabaenopsis sp. FSS-46]|nr:Rpn family recombination-promoting nuclease/putative transposase [Anabaenopsis sp. FSS-46]